MNVSLNVDINGKQLASEFLKNSCLSYEQLIELILEMDSTVADVDFTLKLIKELSKSVQGEFEIGEYNAVIESLKIKGD